MKANSRYLNRPHDFWALVKFISERLGYSTSRKSKGDAKIRFYELKEVEQLLISEKLEGGLQEEDLVRDVIGYLNDRADTLNELAPKMLMDKKQAAKAFKVQFKKLKPLNPVPFNKQKGAKRHPAYLTGLVSMNVEKVFGNNGYDPDPRTLSILTTRKSLRAIFSRRFDGALPSTRNPLAVWEVKEYYDTKTFGSRVADGVYETLLDGFEIVQFEHVLKRKVSHYLFIDDYFTWWICGKSYLCRIYDMLHSGHVDEVFLGREVILHWPQTLRELKKRL